MSKGAPHLRYCTSLLASTHDFVLRNSFAFFFRIKPGESYFDRLPRPVFHHSIYKLPCSCYEIDIDGRPECTEEVPVHYPSLQPRPTTPVALGQDNNSRGRRNIKYTDDLTDEDFELFKRSVGSGVSIRHKRATSPKPQFPKANATQYCKEKISDTKLGKSCAKLGAHVQAMVNSCIIDLQVIIR